MVKHYIIAGIIGAVITFVSLRSCGSNDKPTTTEIQYKDTTIYVHDTVFKGEGKGVLKYTYSGMMHDTILERMYITTNSGDTVQSFTATLDTIQNKDTLHLEFTYPSSMFRYHLNRQADSVSVVYTTTTNTITIEPPKFSFGLQVGFGYLISWRTGQTAIGSYVGVGANYKL